MVGEITDILSKTGIFIFILVLGLILTFIFTIINNARNRKMAKIPVVIESRKNYEELSLAFNSAVKALNDHGLSVPENVMEARELTLAKLNQYKDMNIMNLVDVISSDVSRVADNVIAALEDGKINWQDTDEAFRIIGSLSDITKKWKDMKDEVTDIDLKEAEILIATLFFEYQKLKGKIENA